MAGCCDPRAPRPKMINIGGRAIGVLGLDEVIREVAGLEPITEERRMSELLTRFRKLNYFPDSAREKYADALAGEYEKYIADTKKLNQAKLKE